MKKISLMILMVSALGFVSCESSTSQDISVPVTNPNYTANIAPVIGSKCVSCHSGGNQNPNLETYAQVKNATQSGSLLCRINGSCGAIMPPSGALPSATIAMITLWKTQGYLEN